MQQALQGCVAARCSFPLSFFFFLTICLPSSGSYFSISLFSVQMSVSPGFSSLFACYSLLFLPDSWTTQPRCVRVCAGAVLYKSQISSWGVSRETPSWINTFVGYSLWPSEDARITVYWVIIKSISPVLVWFSFFIQYILWSAPAGFKGWYFPPCGQPEFMSVTP